MNSVSMLERLVAFDTVFDRPNRELIDFVASWFRSHGIDPKIMPGKNPGFANLWATVGSTSDGGVCLSGHTDVVPVDGQPWSSDPFRLTEKDGKLYGRGTCDMKGFCASALAMLPEMIAAPLKRPIHFCLTHTEENGCGGALEVVSRIGRDLPKPDMAIVGEPTSLRVVSGHKGMRRLSTVVAGREAHSARPDIGVSAVMVAGRLIARLAEMAEAEKSPDKLHHAFVPPYSTIHVGMVQGGLAPSIIARHCTFCWDIRTVPGTNSQDIFNTFEQWVRSDILPEMQAIWPRSSILTTTDFDIPPLTVEPVSSAERLVRCLTGDRDVCCVGYATEAGLFQQEGIDTVLCGPGSIAQAHKPDEFVLVSELRDYDAFLTRLVEQLC